MLIDQDIANLGDRDNPFAMFDKEEGDNSDSPSEKKEDEKESPSHQGEKDNEENKEEEKEEENKEEEKEEKEEEDNTDDESKLPFHKHPRWKMLNEENKTLRTTVDDLKKFKEDFESGKLSQKIQNDDSQAGEETVIPKWFSEYFGEDEAAYKEFQNSNKSYIEQTIKAQQDQQIQKQKEIEESQKKWNQWIDDSISYMQSDDKHEAFEKNELLDVMKKYNPTMPYNGKSIPDFEKGYEILQLQKAQLAQGKKEDNDKRKKMADISDNKIGENQSNDVKTPKDLKGLGFFDY